MGVYRIYVKVELFDDSTDERVTWDDDTCFINGDRVTARGCLQKIVEAATQASEQVFVAPKEKP